MKSLDAILARHGEGGRQVLIPVLQEVQESEGYISPEAIAGISRRLGLPTSKIYGVATFYNQFRFHAPGKFHVQVCRGTACHVKGSKNLLDALQRELKIKPDETSRDGVFSLEVVACIGACGLAPAMSVNGRVYARMTPRRAVGILKACREAAQQEAVK